MVESWPAIEKAISSILSTRQGRQLAMQGPWWSERARIRAAVRARLSLAPGSAEQHWESGWAHRTLPDLFAELGRAGETPQIEDAGQAWVRAYERLVAAERDESSSGAQWTGSALPRALNGLLELLDSPDGVHAWRARPMAKRLGALAAGLDRTADDAERRAEAGGQVRRARGSAGGFGG